MFGTKTAEALLERWAKWSNDRDRSLVDNPPGARGLFVRNVILFVAVLAAWGFYAFASDGPDGWWGWLRSIVGALLGWWIGLHALSGIHRATAYRTGWLDGRTAMVDAMQRAQLHGLSAQQWLTSELHRDLFIMGVPPDDWPML